MKGKSMVVSFLVAILLVSGITEKAVWAQKLTPVKASFMPIVALLPVFMGKEKGIFKEEGLDVEIVPMWVDQQIMFAVSGGSVQIGMASISGLIQSWEKGFDYIILGPTSHIGNKTPDMIGTAVRKDSGINRFKDLEGKIVATVTIRGLTWTYTSEMIMREGGDPGRVRWLELPYPNMPEQLERKQIDAATLTEPATTIVRLNPQMKMLGYEFVEINPGGLHGAIIATREWARANPDLAARFARGLEKAIDYTNGNQAEWPAMIEKFSGIKGPLAANVTPPVWKKGVDEKNLEWYVDFLFKHGLIKRKVDVKGRKL